MDHYGYGQKGLSNREEIRSSVPMMGSVVCPKPRRVGLLNPSSFHNTDHNLKSLRWHLSHQGEMCDSKSATDLLDIILTKGGCGGVEQLGSSQIIASSPPFFCGSPPSRVSNPLIQDVRFGDEKFSPQSPLSPVAPSGGISSSPSSPTSSTRKGGGCVRGNFGNNPAVRVEGFDCLDRDGRNRRIPAWA